MSGFVQMLNSLPPWVGSVPAWSLLIVAVSAILIQRAKNQPIIEQQRIEERLRVKEGYVGRINTLEEKVDECERRCDEREAVLKAQINGLEDQLHGMRRQHVQEQISLVTAIVSSVGDNPALGQLLKTLEEMQAAARVNVLQSQVGNVLPPKGDQQ